LKALRSNLHQKLGNWERLQDHQRSMILPWGSATEVEDHQITTFLIFLGQLDDQKVGEMRARSQSWFWQYCVVKTLIPLCGSISQFRSNLKSFHSNVFRLSKKGPIWTQRESRSEQHKFQHMDLKCLNADVTIAVRRTITGPLFERNDWQWSWLSNLMDQCRATHAIEH
jgi:hypothetical protein